MRQDISVPRVAIAATWPVPAPVARGLSRTTQTQLLAQFRALLDPDDEGHVVGGGCH